MNTRGNPFEGIVVCQYCDNMIAHLKSGELVYGPRYAGIMLYVCQNWPKCDAYVGCHRGTHLPLGTLANRTLRLARKRAHKALDPMWQSGSVSRSTAYYRLRKLLNIPRDKAHIAMLDVDQCHLVEEHFGRKRGKEING